MAEFRRTQRDLLKLARLTGRSPNDPLLAQLFGRLLLRGALGPVCIWLVVAEKVACLCGGKPCAGVVRCHPLTGGNACTGMTKKAS